MQDTDTNLKLSCYHCGEEIRDEDIIREEKHFCCSGCLFVFELLNQSDMAGYYDKFGNTGLSLKSVKKADFDYLDDPRLVSKLLLFSINNIAKVRLYVPQIYCSACIWLLENLNRLKSGIIESKVNFLKKEITIVFNESEITLRQLFELLHQIGYTPKVDVGEEKRDTDKPYYKSLYIKLGIAGFAFGNLMLFALPEYLSGGELDVFFHKFLGILNGVLAFFVLYASSDYFKSAWQSIKLKHINLDFPISLGILALFLRSLFEIITGTGSGYVDSMSGLVFFLLTGKIFQLKTYHHLSFEKDFKSYFPISVVKKKGNSETTVPVNTIKEGDILIIRNNELLPTDALLISDKARIDYSFITGESVPVERIREDVLYAGGKVAGGSIEIAATKEFESSFLMEIWNNKVLKEDVSSRIRKFSDIIGKYFTIGVLIVSSIAFIFWMGTDIHRAINAFTAILLIACPCAIALTMPFTYGTVMRILGKQNVFLKNDSVVENLSRVDTIVFDKTGTLTSSEGSKIEYYGEKLSKENLSLVKSTVRNSTHPLSRIIFENLLEYPVSNTENFSEEMGSGIEAVFGNDAICAGSYRWLAGRGYRISAQFENSNLFSSGETSVFVAINGVISGCYVIRSSFRNDLSELFRRLSDKYELHILSGDSDKDKSELEKLIDLDVNMNFNQLPDDKIEFIKGLRAKGKNVMMVGDGLNDAGALKLSNFGLAVSENIANFTPASDGIMLSDVIKKLPEVMHLSRKAMSTVIISFIISMVYNLFGFYFAAQGTLSPLIAAILMPVSSVSVVLFTVFKIRLNAKQIGF